MARAKMRPRSTKQVLKMKAKIRSFGDLQKLLTFASREFDLLSVLQGVSDPRRMFFIPLYEILLAQVLAFVGIGQSILQCEEMFCSQRLLSLIGTRRKRIISDTREREILLMLNEESFQKQALVPLVKRCLPKLTSENECLRGIRQMAVDLTTISGFAVVNGTLVSDRLSIPAISLVPAALEERELDPYRSKDSLLKRGSKRNEEPKNDDDACKGRGLEIPATKKIADDFISSFGEGVVNLVSVDAKHLVYEEIDFFMERMIHLLIRIRKDDGRKLLLVRELEDHLNASRKLKQPDPELGHGEGVDYKRQIKWKLDTLLVKKGTLKDLKHDVVVCKLTQESLDGAQIPEEERERYLVVTKTDISFDAIYEISKRHWQVEENHKRYSQYVNSKHIWSHDATVVWNLFTLMQIALLLAKAYHENVIVMVFGEEELRKDKVGLLVMLRYIREAWRQRRRR